MPIPVTILGGYLGVGKTTAVNHLLRHANGRRIAVLVNDFGTLPIDADLVEADDGDLLTLAGGCVCCSYGDDLVRALIELAARTPAPDHVVIETSGVALPGAVARSLTLLFAYARDAIVVLADAVTTGERLDDSYMGDTLARQFADADILVVNKTDLIDPAALARLRDRLATTFPDARLLSTTYGLIDPDVLLGLDGSSTTRSRARASSFPSKPISHATASYHLDGVADVSRLAAALASLDLVRAKGFLRAADGTWQAIHLAGRRVSFDPAPRGTAGPQRLVCIATGNSIDTVALEATLTAAGLTATLV